MARTLQTNGIAFVSIVLGAFAYHHNRASHNKKFSTILSFAHDTGLMNFINEHYQERIGSLPLPEQIGQEPLRFGTTGMGRWGLGFRRASTAPWEATG
jgi:hypothetical protein